MVGDTMETDIRGALELGFHTVLALTGAPGARGSRSTSIAPH